MEKLLIIWIENNCQIQVPVDSSSIQQKALAIFQQLKDEEPIPSAKEFSASKGWFDKFKKRHNLHHIRHKKGELATSDGIELVKGYHPARKSDDSKNIADASFNRNVISNGLRLGRELQTYFLNNDPDTERAMNFHTKIQEALCQYEELCASRSIYPEHGNSNIIITNSYDVDDTFEAHERGNKNPNS